MKKTLKIGDKVTTSKIFKEDCNEYFRGRTGVIEDKTSNNENDPLIYDVRMDTGNLGLIHCRKASLTLTHTTLT